jgi:hypothetical protein
VDGHAHEDFPSGAPFLRAALQVLAAAYVAFVLPAGFLLPPVVGWLDGGGRPTPAPARAPRPG